MSNAAEDNWETPVRVVWIDNEPTTGQSDYLEEILAEHQNIAEVLLVRSDEEQGLTLKDLRRAAALLGVEPPPGSTGTRRSVQE